MERFRLIYAFVLSILLIAGCTANTSLVNFVKEGGLEAKGIRNLALASNGARVTVSVDNPDHPGSTLNNGVTSSENWEQGEGWEVKYEGALSRGEYTGYGVENPMLITERMMSRNREERFNPNASFDSGDPSWRGLRTQTEFGEVNTAEGWVIIEFPEEKLVNRAVIYTVDSEKYPAGKFGVSDLSLQYWSNFANSWATVERSGKEKGQAGNAILNNKNGVITLRFEPVKTPKMRLIIRWTNDSQSYNRGYIPYAVGTIRLVEVEIYGYEKEKEEQIAPAVATQETNKAAEIKVLIDSYVEGYNRKDIGILMSSISSDYRKNGETYSDLKKKMGLIFAKYEELKIELNNLSVKLTDDGATATSSYTAQYKSSADASPVRVSGVLTFSLSNAGGHWKITRIDSR